MKKIFKHIVTLGPIGYLPAPGTCGTTLALVLLYVLHRANVSLLSYALFVFVLGIVGWYCVVHALDFFERADPPQIIIDEVIGCLLTFFMIPLSLESIIVGFLLFRLLDISKPCGVKNLERMGGAWGILLDDVGAGIISNIILHVLVYIQLI